MKRQRDTAPLVKAVGGIIKEQLARRDVKIDGLIDVINTLAARVKTLEQQQKSICYCGTWEPGRKYAKGNFVTDGGSVWHCDRETTQRPGPGDAWTLAVKRGRDA